VATQWSCCIAKMRQSYIGVLSIAVVYSGTKADVSDVLYHCKEHNRLAVVQDLYL
jgi:hypothetical protein